jgi:hypothetical protein
MKTFHLIFTAVMFTSSMNSQFDSIMPRSMLVPQDEGCAVPARQPVALEFTEVTKHSISAKFVNVERADNYLVLRSTKHRLSVLPQNQNRYAEGDTLGDAVVVDYTSEERFTAIQLEQNTTYYFYIFAVSDNCVKGPLYNTAAPLSDKAITF